MKELQPELLERTFQAAWQLARSQKLQSACVETRRRPSIGLTLLLSLQLIQIGLCFFTSLLASKSLSQTKESFFQFGIDS